MGFLEKLKNTFFEEEYIEVEEKVKPKKETRKAPSNDIKPLIEEEKKVRNIRKDEIVHEGLTSKKYEENKAREVEKTNKQEAVKGRQAPKNNFSYFDDADFIDFTDFEEEVEEKPIKEEKKPAVSEKQVESTKIYNNPNYASKTNKTSSTVTTISSNSTDSYAKQKTSGFKPTPIISPIYGILDQNYTKDEIIEKKEARPSSYVSRKNVDLDSVREKAFGSLSSDLGLTEKTEDEIDNIENNEDSESEIEDNLLYDMTDVTTTPTVDKVTLQDAEEYFQDLGLEYNIDYKDAKLERATGRRVSKTPKTPEIEEDEVKIEEKSDENNEEYSFSVEDNLFDLIDSMYEEKE